MFCYGYGTFQGVTRKWQCQDPEMFVPLKIPLATRNELVVVVKDGCTKDKCPTQKGSVVFCY